MNHKIKYIAKNRSGVPLKPIGITLHETATPGATAENSYQYFNREQVGASAHVFVDWNERIQMVPYNECAWHAGPTANSRYIGVEMCRPNGYNPEQFKRVWEGTVELFAELCKTYGFTAQDINTHHEISLRWGETDHTDPTAFLAEYGEDINSFKKAVEEKINGGLTMTQYEELRKELDELKNRFSTYAYIDENTAKIASDANAALKAAVDKGIVGYGKNGFEPGLSKDTIRIIVWQYRLGLFG